MKETKFIKSVTPGGEFFIEVDSIDGFDEIVPTSSKDNSESNFDKAMQMLNKNTKFVIDNLKELGLDEIEVSCGLKMGVEGGNSFWGLAKVTSEANISVKVVWKAKEGK